MGVVSRARATLSDLLAEQFGAFATAAPSAPGAQLATPDAAALADRLITHVEAVLAVSVVAPRLCTVSAGVVCALELMDRRVVVVKLHPARTDQAVLDAMHRVQVHLGRNGFPCPAPLCSAAPIGDRLATIDAWLDDGGNDFGEGAMQASASGLARTVELARSLDLVGAFVPATMARRRGVAYPDPHSPIFDFTRPDPRVAFIDRLNDRAIAVIDALDAEQVVIHGDWSARNVRFGPEGLRGAYDWDSLIALPECIGVGIAAATWRSFGEGHDAIAPDLDEALAYLAAYEGAAERPFSGAEHHAAIAQVVHTLCYTARCEVSLGPGHPTRAIGRLERSGAQFAAACG